MLPVPWLTLMCAITSSGRLSAEACMSFALCSVMSLPRSARIVFNAWPEKISSVVDNPTTDEIFSGQALNTILADLGKLITEQSANDMQASALSLPDEVIAHINVNHGTGNIALLKRKGDLPWPAALNGPEDADLRAQFAAQARAVVQRAQKEGQIDADLIAEMTRGGEQLKKLLPRIARSQAPDSYVEAKIFIN